MRGCRFGSDRGGFFVADDFFARNNGVLSSHSNIDILELAAPDANRTIRRSLLGMDDGYINLRNRNGEDALFVVERVLDFDKFVIRNLIEGLADFLTDAPFGFQDWSPASGKPEGTEGQGQRHATSYR